MRTLSEAGIPTGVSVAPIIPGLNEEAIPEVLKRARDAGARDATYILLRLTGNIESVFLERMAEAFPDRIRKITNRIREVRGGALTDGRFFRRHAGQGTYWDMIEQLFETGRRKAGFSDMKGPDKKDTFRRPQSGQTTLF